jgi:hypothetical protein
MRTCPYRLKPSIMVVIRETTGYKLRELPAGSVFLPAGSSPDSNRMIDGTCGDAVALMFLRDLEERAEPLAATSAGDPGAMLRPLLAART